MSEVPNIPNLPNVVKARLGSTASGGHPDPDILTAFAEQSLAADEREKTLSHLAVCGDCREIVSLAMPEDSLVAASSVAAAPPRKVSWYFLRWGGAIATASVIITAVITLRPQDAVRPESDAAALVKPQAVETESKDAPVKTGEIKTAPDAAAIANSSKPAPVITEPLAKQTRPTDQLSDLALKPGGQRNEADVSQRGSAASGAGASAQPLGAVAGFGGVGTAAAPAAPPPPAVSVEAQAAAPELAKEERKNSAETRTLDSYRIDETSSKQKKADAQPETQHSTLSPVMTARKRAPAEKALADGQSNTFELSAADAATTQTRVMRQSDVPARIQNGKLQLDSDKDGRWTLSSLSASIAPGTELRAYAAIGASIWAGGKDGALFVSNDSGKSWNSVKGEWKGDIISLTRRDSANASLTTSTGETWTTDNGGKDWKKK